MELSDTLYQARFRTPAATAQAKIAENALITFQRATKATGKHLSRAWLRLKSILGLSPMAYCPACGKDVVGFYRYGDCAFWGCPACDASPRERLMAYLIDHLLLTISPNASVLHMAPNERGLVRRFGTVAEDYVPADLDPKRYPLVPALGVDLMELADRNRFDIVYASHVMEHVPDDAKVLANIHRALKPGGEAWLIVPLWEKPTEDGSFAMPPRERERRFGQWDHVRQYGPDFADRIRSAGFTVDVVAADAIDSRTRRRMGLDDRIFRARKAA